MKLSGYDIVHGILVREDLENKIPSQPDVLPKRPIDALGKESIKGAEATSKEYTAKVTKDPDPKKMKTVDTDKGTAAGDDDGKVKKELDKVKKD
jgi:hypothetical protein